MDLNEKEAALLVALQRGIPLHERPFAELAAAHDVGEEMVIALAERLHASGHARRFGAVFDSRRLGYRSALCAVAVPPAHLDEVAAKVTPVPGVTHAYERGWPDELPRDLPGGPADAHWPNFWFTLSAPAAGFHHELERLRAACQPHAIHELPATRRFKIDVVFDTRTRDRDERVEPRAAHAEQPVAPVTALTPEEQAIIHAMQGHIPVTPRFFAAVADELGMRETALIERLRVWKENGLLRRLGLLLRHREAGFKANGMCCWDMPTAAVTEAGRRVAAFPEVTHCYERPRFDLFPFRLYAMIHTTSWLATQQLFERITRETGLAGGQLLLSVREFKKTSMVFF